MTKKQEGFTSRYVIADHERLKNCRANCGEPRVKCKRCGNFGHYVVHKGMDGPDKVAEVNCMHSHYVENIMKGRNDFCWIKNIPLIEADIFWSWRILPNIINSILVGLKQ